jgi:hypothetical protein
MASQISKKRKVRDGARGVYGGEMPAEFANQCIDASRFGLSNFYHK